LKANTKKKCKRSIADCHIKLGSSALFGYQTNRAKKNRRYTNQVIDHFATINIITAVAVASVSFTAAAVATSSSFCVA